jgi:hypothetical protein
VVFWPHNKLSFLPREAAVKSGVELNP